MFQLLNYDRDHTQVSEVWTRKSINGSEVILLFKICIQITVMDFFSNFFKAKISSVEMQYN